MVPALNTYPSPNKTSVYLWISPWLSPEKFKSISGSLSPSKPRKVSKGISCPSLIYSTLHLGHFLLGKSAPELIEPSVKNSECLHLGQT